MLNLLNAPKYYHYWGKASLNDDNSYDYHLLPYHCLDIAAVGYTFLSETPLVQKRLDHLLPWNIEDSIRIISFFLSIHDLGKYSESFQKLIPDIWKELSGVETQKRYNIRHDSLGFHYWESVVWKNMLNHGFLNEYNGEDDPEAWEYILRSCASAVFGHHGRPPDITVIHDTDPATVYNADDSQALLEFTCECQKLFLNHLPIADNQDYDEIANEVKKFSWLLSGLTIVSDWIGSDPSVFSLKQDFIPLEDYWNNYAIPSAHTGLKKSGVGSFKVSKKTGVRSLFPIFSEDRASDNKPLISPSPLQEFVGSCPIGSGPHLFIIEESTGGGKTEAAITLAHRMMAEGLGEGMYVALPTMATANAMYERMKSCYSRLYESGEHPSLILSHGSRHLSSSFKETIGPVPSRRMSNYGESEEEAGAICATWLSDHKKASLLASIGVGTIDQALVGVLPASHQSLRLFGLLRNILIVDEVHAYDPYMNRLLRSLLAFQAAMGGSAILLSATLPKEQKDEYLLSFADGAGFNRPDSYCNSYPLVTHLSKTGCDTTPISSRIGTSRSVTLEFFQMEESVISQIQNIIDSGGCACWIRNTVSDAMNAYFHFLERYSPDDVLLFHARYTMGDRIAIENNVLRLFGKMSGSGERSGKLLIATQVVEQSLDLDFDYLVSDLAPIDLIIQRAGRLHRHNREGRGSPVMGIYSPPMSDNPEEDWYSSIFQGGSFVYPKHGELWLTLQILMKKGKISTPDDARELVEWVYGKKASTCIPIGLKIRDNKAEDELKKAEGTAMMYALPIKSGYFSTHGRWDDDEKARTRYGETSIILRLGLIDHAHERITPICDGESGSWELSSVSVRRSSFPDSLNYPDSIEKIVKSTIPNLPDKGRFSRLVPLQAGPSGIYSAIICGNKSGLYTISYSKIFGLNIEKSNGKD